MSAGSPAAFIRIVQSSPTESGLTPTQGTRVLCGGQEIAGVTRIELVAEVNDIWRARIDVNVGAIDLTALAHFHRPSLWQRVKGWYASLPPARDGAAL